MKNLIAFAFSLFLLNSMQAQNTEIIKTDEGQTAVAYNQNKTKAELAYLNRTNASVKTTGVNASYLNSSNFTDNSLYVKILQQQAGLYDVTSIDDFDRRDDGTYDVVFDTKRGTMSVTYDSMGKILSSKERFKNVALPKDVIVSIMKQHPSWKFEENTCYIDYKPDQGLSTTYKVKISNGKEMKTVKVDEKGNLM